MRGKACVTTIAPCRADPTAPKIATNPDSLILSRISRDFLAFNHLSEMVEKSSSDARPRIAIHHEATQSFSHNTKSRMIGQHCRQSLCQGCLVRRNHEASANLGNFIETTAVG